MSYIEIWLIVGFCCIAIEFSTIPGIGFLFLGFGALSVSGVLYFYPALEDLIHYQLAALGILSFGWFLLLWWPLKRFIYRKKTKAGGESFNLIGSQVKVFDGPIKPLQLGKVMWSGTIMNAKLAHSELEEAQVGEILHILEVQGNILICGRCNNES